MVCQSSVIHCLFLLLATHIHVLNAGLKCPRPDLCHHPNLCHLFFPPLNSSRRRREGYMDGRPSRGRPMPRDGEYSQTQWKTTLKEMGLPTLLESGIGARMSTMMYMFSCSSGYDPHVRRLPSWNGLKHDACKNEQYLESLGIVNARAKLWRMGGQFGARFVCMRSS